MKIECFTIGAVAFRLRFTKECPICPYMPKARINYALAATLLAAGQDIHHICHDVGAKNVNSLRAALSRKGFSQRMAQAAIMSGPLLNNGLTTKMAIQAGRVLREKLHAETVKAVNLLEREPITSATQLANTPFGQGRAAVLKTVAEVASMVEGWDDDKAAGLVLVGTIAKADPEAIDVESTPSVVSCGGSGEQIESNTPQDSVSDTAAT